MGFVPEHRARLVERCPLFFSTTFNQTHTLVPVYRQFQRAAFLKVRQPTITDLVTFDLDAGLLWGLKPTVIGQTITSILNRDLRRLGGNKLMRPGVFEEMSYLMKILKPPVVVVANDHSPMPIAICHAARKHGIKTVYLPHAHVNDLFPPLSFDLSLLPGQACWDSYKQAGPIRGQVKLIGTPKLDESRGIPRPTCLKALGICCNRLDNYDRVAEVARTISETLPGIRIIFRPHPADARKRPAELKRYDESVTAKETAAEFLGRVDAIICGSSSIPLEAAIVGRPAVHFDFGGRTGYEDYYGFERAGLVRFASTLQDLIEQLKQWRTAININAEAFAYFESPNAESGASLRAAQEIIKLFGGSEEQWLVPLV